MINGEDYLKPSIRLSPIPEVPSNNSELDSLSSLEKQQSDINSIIVPITITNSLPPPPPPPSPIKSDTQENEFRPPETAIVVNKKKSWWCC
jgi:hypothetical protein